MEFDNLKVCAVNWEHDSWEESFYPEGMPKDWRLEFYATQFPFVLVSYSIWTEWNEEVYEAFAESIEEDAFGFVLELKPEQLTALAQLYSIQAILGNHLYGVYISEPLQNFEEMHAALDELHEAGLKVAFVLDASDSLTDDLIKDKKTPWQWSWQDKTFVGDPMAVVDLTAMSVEEQKTLLLSFSHSMNGDNAGALLFAAGDVAPEEIKNTQVLAELLGL